MKIRFLPAIPSVIPVLVVIAGCSQGSESGTSVHDQMVVMREAPHPTTEPAAPAPVVPASRPAARPVASINGANIDRKELVDLLIQTHGLGVLQQLMLREAAATEGRKLGMTVSPSDIEAEYDFTLQAEHLNGKDVEKLTALRREQMIEDWTRSRNVSKEELRVAMERQAWLRKIIGTPAATTEADLQKEYEREHGEKVEVRHLQIAAPRYFPQIKTKLEEGASFESVVKEFSQNKLTRDQGGLLPPFTATDETITTVLAKAAFALKVGEYTNPIESLGNYHVLKLERRIPPDGVPFEQVKATLKRRLEARRMMQAMEAMGTRLIMQSEIRIEDPVLREQYKKAQASKQIEGPILIGQ